MIIARMDLLFAFVYNSTYSYSYSETFGLLFVILNWGVLLSFLSFVYFLLGLYLALELWIFYSIIYADIKVSFRYHSGAECRMQSRVDMQR